VGSTRLDLKLEPGSHTVRIEKTGYDTFSKRIDLEAGEQRTVKANMTGRPPIPTIAQLQRRGLEPLSGTELQSLHMGNTLYYHSLRAGSVTPVFYARTGAAMALFENGLIEGRYWIANDTLCVEDIPPDDLCASVFKDGETYRACNPRDEGLCVATVNRIEPGDSEGLHRPTEAQLRNRGLVQLSDAALLELVAGNTVYVEDRENDSIIPIYHLQSGRRRLIVEERFFEGSYWVSKDKLCFESVSGGDVCTPIFKDEDVYRMCHPNPDFACRWFFRRIEVGNSEGLRPD
jgi:hypothetical protein